MSEVAMPAPRQFTRTDWLICIIASIGFLFDTYELLMLPLVIRPAIMELLQLKANTPAFQQAFDFWYQMLFFLPALLGGVFGLFGGWLTDRLGRRRVLTGSILLYGCSACAAGFATSMPMLVFFRITTFVGVCVEFVAAVAWLAELFPNPQQREKVLGWTQAFSSLGGLLVAWMFDLATIYRDGLPAIHGVHEPWRYTLISGLIPAIPLILIRPFLPESPIWARKREAGTLRRPSIAELFHPAYRRSTIVSTLMFACSLGIAFGAIQHIGRITPGTKQLTSIADASKRRPAEQRETAIVQKYQETGGLLGRCALAYLAVHIASRRNLIRIFQVPGLVLTPLVFLSVVQFGELWLFKWGMLFVGFMAVAQLSFWGNYLPTVYPVHLRGTGESFAANIGGRMIGTSAAIVTTQLKGYMPGGTDAIQFAYAAATVGGVLYLIGLTASFFLPEPKRDLADT